MLVLGNLSVLDQQEGKYEEALSHSNAARTLADRLGDQTMVAASHTQAGNVFLDQGDLDAAEREHRASLAIHERLGDESGLARVLTNLSLIASERGDEPAARIDLERGLEIRRRGKETSGIALSLVNLAPTYTNLGLLAEAHAALVEVAKHLLALRTVRVSIYALEAAAHFAATVADWPHVVKFYATAERLRGDLHHAIRSPSAELREAELERAQTEVGAEFMALQNEGAALSLEDALQAVTELPPVR